MSLPGDGIVPNPSVVTNHAVSVDVPPRVVWPWLLQMGWGRGGWYTARWVDRVLFPANGPSAELLIPELQTLRIGDFIPDGPPATECGFVVEVLEPNECLVLHSTSHLPRGWRGSARVDWSWAFVLTGLDDGRRTRFLFRSRWTTAPWWLTAAGWFGIVPADFVMSRAMLRGVKRRAEHRAGTRAGRAGAAAVLRQSHQPNGSPESVSDEPPRPPAASCGRRSVSPGRAASPARSPSPAQDATKETST
jgi:hypothetical protein